MFSAANKENIRLRARIKELENIICPAQQHSYIEVSKKSDVIDGYGTVVYHRRYVCKKCLREYEETDYV